jgi:nucleoside-diphosphate-sugar epimerase
MNIVVTGGAGYLGSVLVPRLLGRGHAVRVVDIGYFGVGHLRTFRRPVELVRQDIRRARSDRAFVAELFDGADCLIHLAAVSNDPSAELNPELTDEVNFQASEALAEAAKRRGVRFLFSSSCSVYGAADGEVDEGGAVQPLTVYGESKVKAERMLASLAGDGWAPVVLRNGTLFGFSPRMRFDLVVNIFGLYGALHGEIKVFGDGRQWRPFLHVGDCARAFVRFTEAGDLEHDTYNVAHENLQVCDVADVFRRVIPDLKVTTLDTPDLDRRDYRVSTARLRATGFRTRTGVEAGAEEVVDAIVSGVIPDPESIYYRNAKWLRELTEIGSRDHQAIVDLMETLAHVRGRAKA